LVVDDDPGIRETLSQILHEEGYTVYEAADGAEAIQQISTTNEPLVVLLDMWMPSMNGEATLLAALEQATIWSRLSFIVMTANPQRMPRQMREILDLHSIPLLVKPFDIDYLVDLVNRRAERFGDVALVERGRRSGSLS
jgi:CheY-like chemotaxis protein